MLLVLRQTWPLLLGIMLLMVGNGMQGTLLGIRGKIEGIDTFYMSLVMSAYFAGFLFGSRMVPEMIARVGHVRVFAALGSLISAILVLYAAFPNWPSWVALRVPEPGSRTTKFSVENRLTDIFDSAANG